MPAEIRRLRLKSCRSGLKFCRPQYVCSSGAGGRGGGGGGDAPLVKSRDPHPTGGEQEQDMKTKEKNMRNMEHDRKGMKNCKTKRCETTKKI